MMFFRSLGNLISKVYNHSMKKIIVIVMAVLLLSSCTSSRREAQLTADAAIRTSENLISTMKNALIDTENTLFTTTIDFSLDSSYQPYLRDLPQFRRTAERYTATATELLHSALRTVTDYMLTYLDDSFVIDNPETYLNAGYSSISAELERRLQDEVEELFYTYIQENKGDLDLVYASLQYEADIWRNNLENLSRVGAGQTIANIVPINDRSLAEYAAASFFTAIGEAEVTLRSGMEVTNEG